MFAVSGVSLVSSPRAAGRGVLFHAYLFPEHGYGRDHGPRGLLTRATVASVGEGGVARDGELDGPAEAGALTLDRCRGGSHYGDGGVGGGGGDDGGDGGDDGDSVYLLSLCRGVSVRAILVVTDLRWVGRWVGFCVFSILTAAWHFLIFGSRVSSSVSLSSDCRCSCRSSCNSPSYRPVKRLLLRLPCM